MRFDRVSEFWNKFKQQTLFPLREEIGPLTDTLERLIRVWEILRIEEWVAPACELGRRPKDRGAIARAFVAKAYFNFSTTSQLVDRLRCDSSLRRLCGFECRREIPSESTFSRAFGEFAIVQLTQRVHEALVQDVFGGKIVGHVSRDSTAIDAREKPKKKTVVVPKSTPSKRGRRKKNEPALTPEMTRLEKQSQPEATLTKMIDELPKACDFGAKRNSKGFAETWQGYKLHLDVSDTGMPLSAILTSASVHDSQVAIPLMRMTEKRTGAVLYELMDSAYDAPLIEAACRHAGRIPIIDINPRSNKEKQDKKADLAVLKKLNLPVAEQLRFKERTAVERANARIKDEFGGRNLRVRGHAKAACHLMFGICVIAADSFLRLVV